MLMRIYYQQGGAHVHMRVFAGVNENSTLGKAGDLCLRSDEFAAWKTGEMQIEFVPEAPKMSLTR